MANNFVKYPGLWGVGNPIIFDLDGTLLDSEWAHKHAEVETFRQLGLEISKSDLAVYTGAGLETTLQQISSAHGIPLTPPTFQSIHQPLLLSLLENVSPYDDAIDLLIKLEGRELALATSSEGWYLEACLQKFDFLRVFKVAVSAWDVVYAKPSPEIFTLACKKLGHEPRNCIAIEDSTHGISSAKSAGCKTIGVERSKNIKLEHADLIVSSLREIDEKDLQIL